MSADNAIFVQKRGRYYHVWEGGMSAPEPYTPSGYDHGVFRNKATANWYAYGLERGLAVVEYGTIEIDPISPLRSIWERIAAHRYWFWAWWIMVRNWYRRKGG